MSSLALRVMLTQRHWRLDIASVRVCPAEEDTWSSPTRRVHWLNRVWTLHFTYSYLMTYDIIPLSGSTIKVTWRWPQLFIMPLSRNFGDSNAGWSPGDHIRINLWRESSAKTSGNSTFAPSVRTVSRISRLDNWFTSRSCQKQFKVSSSERIYVHKIIEEHS